MKELSQVFSKVAEEKIPDKLIDTINLIELDSKTRSSNKKDTSKDK